MPEVLLLLLCLPCSENGWEALAATLLDTEFGTYVQDLGHRVGSNTPCGRGNSGYMCTEFQYSQGGFSNPDQPMAI